MRLVIMTLFAASPELPRDLVADAISRADIKTWMPTGHECEFRSIVE